MSDAPTISQFWNAVRGLMTRLSEGRYWTERREACEDLLKVARQIVGRLREAAEDTDPDIRHWGQSACDQIAKDFRLPLAELRANLETELHKLADLETRRDADDLVATSADLEASEPAPDPLPPEVGPQSVEELQGWLERHAGEVKGKYEAREKGARVILPVPGERRQTIHADWGKKDSRGETIALFYSICGVAREEDYGWALEANASLSRGCFGLIRHGEDRVLIMLLRRRLRELPWQTLPKKLDYLARKADWAEARLGKDDRH